MHSINSIDAVFLTHGHFDHTSGLEKLLTINPKLLVIAQYELAFILMQKGIEKYIPINLRWFDSFGRCHRNNGPGKASFLFLWGNGRHPYLCRRSCR